MKTRNTNTEEVTPQGGGCCSPTVETKASDPCCEQPTDGSSCCDKTESKEVNAVKTGCC